MRGRVACSLILLLLAASPLLSDCGYSNGYSAPFRSTYLDLVIDGNDLWAATGYGVALFDRSVDPPALVATVAIPGTTRVVRVLGGTAWAGSGSKIFAIRKSGRGLAIAGAVDAGGTVNDLVATPLDLYAATSGGIAQFDLLNPVAPVRTAATFATSTPIVTSLALSGATLYAADGDSSVEVFSIALPSIPQKTGTIASLARSISVKATPNRLYVSDGFTTDAFVVSGSSTIKASNSNFGSIAFASLSGDVAFGAGNDRRIHAVDWTTPASPVELFATDVVPNGGNVNRPAAMQVSGARLYVAAGDAGLLTFDVASFIAPYPVRSYGITGTGSAVWVDTRLYAARTSGGIVELVRGSNGSLTAGRQWDSRAQAVYDGGNGFLLSSTGPTLILWTLVSTSPTLVSSATFPAAVVSAVASGTAAVAVLADGSVWSVDLSQTAAVTQKAAGTIATTVARSGTAVVLSRLLDDGTTRLAYYADGNLAGTPLTTTVAGASTSGVTLSGSTAAVFTFSGINLVDFAASSATVVPQSGGAVARALGLSGSRILELTDSALLVWDRAARTLVKTLPLPSEPVALSVDDSVSIAGIASPGGVMTAAFDSVTRTPSLVATQNGNVYYRRIAAAGDRLYLFDGQEVDIYSTTFGLAPHYVASIRPAGIVAFAATPTRVYTLSANGTIASFGRDGSPLLQTVLSEGQNVQALGISSAGDAVWVSIARGCLTDQCEKKTIVFDGATLVRTASLDGAAVAVTSANGTAWAIFDLPAEVRSYALADPAHPSLTGSVATSGSRVPVSLTLAGSSLYVLGERLSVYNAGALGQPTDFLQSYQADPAGAYTYVDQRIALDTGCGLVTGRSTFPQVYAGGQWTSATAAEVPAPVRDLAQLPGRIYLLTDDSIEVLTTAPGAPAPRHRAVH